MLMSDIQIKIKDLASKYSAALKKVMDDRVAEMESDENSHYLIYRVLGVTDGEGKLIDVYQNKGRFLYKYAGSFLEEASILCFEHKFPNAKRKVKIPNKIGVRPRTFEIDCLIGKEAFELKWKDATTDGDHITKEHTRLKSIKERGYTPIRVMFYYPNRTQAMRIQESLQTLYKGCDGEYHFGDGAWNYIKKKTSIDLKGILTDIAAHNVKRIKLINGK